MRKINSNFRMDTRSTEELIRIALCAQDNDSYWQTVELLQYRGNREVYNAMRRLSTSVDPQERALSADTLGRLGKEGRAFPNEVRDMLLSLLGDRNPDVLAATAMAIGHRQISEGITDLLKLIHHYEKCVRQAVVFALGRLIWVSDDKVSVINALLEMSSDLDKNVRLEAISSLAFVESDSEAINEALYRCADDEEGEVRANALLGLAIKHDPNAVDLIIRELSKDIVYDDTLDAAARTSDERLLPVLLQLKEDEIEGQWLDRAIRSCSKKNERRFLHD